MTLTRRNWLRYATTSSAALATGLSPFALQAQSQAAFPNQSVKVVVPYPAGGIVDINTRILTDELSKLWHQPVVVDNRPGGNGNIGAEAVRQSKPNGLTLLSASNFLVFNPLMDKATRYKTQDFAPIVQMGSAPALLIVPSSLPVNTLAEFIAHAKANPKQLNAASPGIGTVNILAIERLAAASGIELETVLYQGQPPYLLDLAQNRVQIAAVTSTLAQPYLKSGQFRALAVVGEQRIAALPEVRTLGELGFADASVSGFAGLVAPAATPADVQARIQASVLQVFQSKAAQERFAQQQIQLPRKPEHFAALVASEQKRWASHFASLEAKRSSTS